MNSILDTLVEWGKRLALIGVVIGLAVWFVDNPSTAAGYVVGILTWFKDAAVAVITFCRNVITGMF